GVRRDDCEAVEHAPGQQPALPREAPPLVIGEPQPAAVQLLAEDPILFDVMVDRGLLAAVDPSGEEQRAGTATAQQTSVRILLSEDARRDLRHSANLTTSESFRRHRVICQNRIFDNAGEYTTVHHVVNDPGTTPSEAAP